MRKKEQRNKSLGGEEAFKQGALWDREKPEKMGVCVCGTQYNREASMALPTHKLQDVFNAKPIFDSQQRELFINPQVWFANYELIAWLWCGEEVTGWD